MVTDGSTWAFEGVAGSRYHGVIRDDVDISADLTESRALFMLALDERIVKHPYEGCRVTLMRATRLQSRAWRVAC